MYLSYIIPKIVYNFFKICIILEIIFDIIIDTSLYKTGLR